jgi:glycosyltransferase involved in cell wall biosynthesis
LVLRSFVTYLFRLSLSLVFKVVFLNADDLNEFINLGVVDKKKSIVLGGIGVDLKDWIAVPSISNPITFLLAARLLKEKGVVEFYEAARKIKSVYPSTRFILLGGMDINPTALSKSEVEMWVREGVLEWPGNVLVKPWLAQASVFVLPSYREGVPRSTQEAMALGRPVITTDVPGCRDTVVDGRNGFLVPVRDSFALAAAMLKFIDNPELINSMGFESRTMAEDIFDANKFNARLLQILNE